MANQRPADTLEQHQHEVLGAFARAAVAMRDAANTAENFSNWFSRLNNLQNIPAPPMFNGGGINFVPNYGGPQQQYPSAQSTSPVTQTGKKRKAADDPDGKKKKKEKKIKDPNAPKRPPSPYLLFQNEVRKSIQAKHPDIPYGQLLTEIAKIWKEMSPEDKAPYQASQALMKAKYEEDKDHYEANPGAQSTVEVVAPVNKAPSIAPVVSKTVAQAPDATSDDSSDESTEPSSSNDEDEDDEEPAPEPPRKKSKKEAVKAPTPPPAKAGKKKEKSVEGKKKKKTVDT